MLPLDRLVKSKEKGPLSYRFEQVLTAYGATGAQPTLRIP